MSMDSLIWTMVHNLQGQQNILQDVYQGVSYENNTTNGFTIKRSGVILHAICGCNISSTFDSWQELEKKGRRLIL